MREVVLDRAIDPVTARFVTGQIDAADDARRRGRADPDRHARRARLVDAGDHPAELAAKIPVLTFVAPDGARSASAGVFVMMASDLAAMAPQTNIGSSTPVARGRRHPGRRPQEQDRQRRRRAHPRARDRRTAATPTGPRRRCARPPTSPRPRRSQLGVIEIIATDTPDLLRQADGRTTMPKGITLDLDGRDDRDAHAAAAPADPRRADRPEPDLAAVPRRPAS